MGKLDQSLMKIKAHERASQSGPDSDENQNVPPNVSEPIPVRTHEVPVKTRETAVRAHEVYEEQPIIPHQAPPSSSVEQVDDVHPSFHYSPGVKVTEHEEDLFSAVNKIESFMWHPHVEVCRTQTNAFEEFKKLRTNLINLVDRRGVKTFMITSCKHAEGKTTTALALARSLADLGGRRVCLIDGDLRRPRVKNFLGLKIKKGLDDVILDEADLSEAMIYSKDDNLTVLPTRKGRSIASELLGSERMGAIVRDLCKNFDIMIFDSPPCLSTTDPIVLGSLIDAISLTVKMNHTPRQSVEHSIQLMRQSELPFIGLILTHHVVHYNTYLLQKYNYYQDYYGYYAYQDSENAG